MFPARFTDLLLFTLFPCVSVAPASANRCRPAAFGGRRPNSIKLPEHEGACSKAISAGAAELARARTCHLIGLRFRLCCPLAGGWCDGVALQVVAAIRKRRQKPRRAVDSRTAPLRRWRRNRRRRVGKLGFNGRGRLCDGAPTSQPQPQPQWLGQPARGERPASSFP